MKSFYSVLRPVTLVHVFTYSFSMIMYAYLIVMVIWFKITQKYLKHKSRTRNSRFINIVKCSNYTSRFQMFKSEESFIVIEVIKVMMTALSVTVEVFIFCYLFELVDNKVRTIRMKKYIHCYWLCAFNGPFLMAFVSERSCELWII